MREIGFRATICCASVAIASIASAVTVEVAPGQTKAVEIAAQNLRDNLDRVCPAGR